MAFTSISPAQTLSREDQGLLRIDLAGSQRMLSQRALRGACYTAAGLGDPAMSMRLNADIAEFKRRTSLILDGDDGIGLDPERSPIIRSDYEDRVLVPWQTFETSAVYIAARGYAEGTELHDMAERGQSILDDLDMTVSHYEEKYARGNTLGPEESRTLNVYAAQRMLSQRVANQHCLVALEVNSDAARQRLAGSFERFDTALRDMENGNVDERMLPPSRAVEPVLACMRRDVEAIRPAIMSAVSGARPTQPELALLRDASSRLLVQAQGAVTLLQNELTGLAESDTVPPCGAP
ncbi:type IV pili methyl-accepting chemotaxis transducer N-terminal domain-containing protein [Pontivivens ytuae]|uniref:type IV pili methyl-accepting chemotaxis transducer N-terminal domain-containing protein n=1 Tax=Pontivivens ytuae TaxID=2789856 RepID=UPI001E3FA461|nr:type IV pili methyl-accepting chemotaxis transducer N-terminal domain-containing protein [Pontivivens ytuae]